MSLEVSQHIEGHYELRLAEPEKTWVEILAVETLSDKDAIVALVFERGIIELMVLLGRPKPREYKPA